MLPDSFSYKWSARRDERHWLLGWRPLTLMSVFDMLTSGALER